MNRTAAAALIVIGAFSCATGGWFANDLSRSRACPDYSDLAVDVTKLAEYSLEKVSDQIVGQVQRCWAANPFEGPQYVLHLVDARQASDGQRYVIFEPWGVTDIQLVYSVDAKNRLTGVHVRGTL